MRRILLGLFIFVMSTSGCSVFMAMHGKKDANLSVLTVGQDRGVVTLNLGEPVQTYVKDGMTVDIYEVQHGNEPSGGRAIGHAAMDLLTFGGWEIIGTPVEGFQGETSRITVEYDSNNKLVSVNTVTGHIAKEQPKKESTETTKVSEQPKTNFSTKTTVEEQAVKK